MAANNTKQALNLMQNCVLPPPLELLYGPGDTHLPLVHYKAHDVGTKRNYNNGVELHGCRACSRNDNLEEIAKALRLSQARTRDAEKKLMAVLKERERISNLMIEDSLQFFAYRQWISLLQYKVLRMQTQKGESHDDDDGDEGSNISTNKTLYVAVALCLAFAGMGFVYGCTCTS